MYDLPEPEQDLDKCPGCGGPADNGFDRCIPPSPYYCTKCTKQMQGKTMGIKYMKGDLFELVDWKSDTIKVLPHVVNNCNVFASGFVVPLSKHFPQAKSAYHNWFEDFPDYDFGPPLLGEVQVVKCLRHFCEQRGELNAEPLEADGGSVYVVHMCSQDNISTPKNGRRLHYPSLVECMEKVADFIVRLPWDKEVEIVAPKFGSAIAGGNWMFIEELINDIWGDFDVTVYELE